MLADIETMDQKTAEQALKKLLKDPEIHQSLMDNPHLYSKVDEIANTICLLEDRIEYLTRANNAIHANATRWGRVAEKPQAD
jgi:hypothetical protein